jgi:membrane protein implicated in regulation of membrane protease activity
MDIWIWIWSVMAAVLIIGEIFTAGFFLLPFGIGAAVAAAMAYFGLALGWQWAGFLVVAISLLLSLRRFADRVTHEPPERVGVDRLIGKRGTVIEDIEPEDGTGRVRIEREEWRADSESSEIIPAGTHVIVDRIVGTHVVVHAEQVVSGVEE